MLAQHRAEQAGANPDAPGRLTLAVVAEAQYFAQSTSKNVHLYFPEITFLRHT
jgi:hypothetical protein